MVVISHHKNDCENINIPAKGILCDEQLKNKADTCDILTILTDGFGFA